MDHSSMSLQSSRGKKLLLIAAALSSQFGVTKAAWPCTSDNECQELFRKESLCVEGYCSNPFVKGCLRTLRQEGYVNKQRVCNADDDPVLTDCVPASELDFTYPEVRVHNNNWESAIFQAWIFQILFTEVLDVPARVGVTADLTGISGFYSPQNTVAYAAKSYPWDALKRNEEISHCSTAEDACLDIMPEVWIGQQREWTNAMAEGWIDRIVDNGQVSKMSMYIPRFAAQSDPTLVSTFGLSGIENREKLAQTFRMPTSWGDYCNLISEDDCGSKDDTAQRAPTESEKNMYFLEGQYNGFFRLTESSNCTAFPNDCHGYVVSSTCEWSMNVPALMHWNNVPLALAGPLVNGGYPYSNLIEIWRAANATKSAVMMNWWVPEGLEELFQGTDGEFQQVLFPRPSHECSVYRSNMEQRCSEDPVTRIGDPRGACDSEPHALQKVMAMGWVESILDEPIATRSPAYELTKSIRILDLEIQDLFYRWQAEVVDMYGNDAREAVCGWVADNLDKLEVFIPNGYPRKLVEGSYFKSPFMYSAIIFGCFSVLLVIMVTCQTYTLRQTRVFVRAQMHIIYLMMFGFFLISIGAILSGLYPSIGVCVSQVWIVNLGYSFELVPLFVKVRAINRLLSSAMKMRRVRISREDMFQQVGYFVFFVIVFLVSWTIIDPPSKVDRLFMEDINEPTVESIAICSSNHRFWMFIALGWQGILLFIASVLAFQSRNAVSEFNESKILAVAIYSHLIFLVLRFLVISLESRGYLRPNITPGATSFLLSLDTLMGMVIYMAPKMLKAKVYAGGDDPSSREVESNALSELREAAEKEQQNRLNLRISQVLKRMSTMRKMGFLNESPTTEETPAANPPSQAYINTRHQMSAVSALSGSALSDVEEVSHEDSSEDHGSRFLTKDDDKSESYGSSGKSMDAWRLSLSQVDARSVD